MNNKQEGYKKLREKQNEMINTSWYLFIKKRRLKKECFAIMKDYELDPLIYYLRLLS